jgi:hypothetical protein
MERTKRLNNITMENGLRNITKSSASHVASRPKGEFSPAVSEWLQDQDYEPLGCIPILPFR